ncbi:hypothetical protein Scep_014777 [Stephania cephalantha]|uniref:Uncharacterized protein n=2 Tax=Stephania TaxID=147243 RepID=A0AAP0J1T7_9MAGN
MCPLRLILLFISATLAGFLVFKNLKSRADDDVRDSDELVKPVDDVPRSKKVFSAIGSGFWTCVDMASGRYLWRHLKQS